MITEYKTVEFLRVTGEMAIEPFREEAGPADAVGNGPDYIFLNIPIYPSTFILISYTTYIKFLYCHIRICLQ